jgi:hypothetical protein
MDIEVQKNFILACMGTIPMDGEMMIILRALQKDVEEMEKQPISTEALIERVKEARPINAVDIADLFTKSS